MINTIVGLMNSGKTLYMTYKLFLAYCKGKTILTNYDVGFPHFKINKDWLIDFTSKEKVLENVAIGLDEIWIWLDCREAQKNTVFTYFFLQSSKDDTEIYLTAQNNEQIDRRIRQNLHKISQCSRAVLIDGEYKNINDEQRFLSDEMQDKLYIKVIDFKRMNFGLMSDMMPIETKFIFAKNIFKLYNTKE